MINHCTFSSEFGAATLSLGAEVDGKIINVFPRHDLEILKNEILRDSTLLFKKFNVPLFPMANRLLPEDPFHTGDFRLGEKVKSEIENIPVRILLNNIGKKPNAIPHHLHGIVYRAKGIRLDSETTFFKGFFQNEWTGDAELTVNQSIQNGQFHYKLFAKNVSDTRVPTGFGSHCYFQIPSFDPSAARLKIPASKFAEIDNLDNVLPTGNFLPVSQNDGRLDFRNPKALPAGVIDNFFKFDKKYQKVELIDVKAKLKYIITALSANIMGAQIFYPGEGSIIAIEMVTHLPDPRKTVWKQTPTGMKILTPGESDVYHYKISVLPVE